MQPGEGNGLIVDDRPCCRRERGAAAVELALVMPLLVMLVFGIFEFGRVYYVKTQLSGAVREGARVRALGGDADETIDKVLVAAPGVGLDEADVNAGTACPPGGTADATVSATYDVVYSIPFVSSGTWPISVTGVMRCGL